MRKITLRESELINIIRRVVNETDELKQLQERDPRVTNQWGGPATPAAAPPPCAPPVGPGGNGLGLSGGNLGIGCCGKCDNLPNPLGPFTPAELTYLGPCAPHCGCC